MKIVEKQLSLFLIFGTLWIFGAKVFVLSSKTNYNVNLSGKTNILCPEGSFNKVRNFSKY